MPLKAWRFPARTLKEIAARAAREGISQAVLVRRAVDRDLSRFDTLDQIDDLRRRVEILEQILEPWLRRGR
jgi:hypothetical protein